jgi:recombination protein RecR
MNLPSNLQSLIDELCKLPGVGPKTALRYLFHLLNQPREYLESLGERIKNLPKNFRTCSVCFNFSEIDPCAICAASNRDKSVLCVVATPQDLSIVESTGEFKGVYHVLGGVLNPLEGITADKLRIKELRNRIDKNGIKEIILALNPDMQGETTMLYLKRMIQTLQKPVKVTRLARGLPVGATVEYADEVTLSDALKDRKEI